MEDKDLQITNEIDMEIDPSLLDDDDSFGSMPIKNSKPNTFGGQKIDVDEFGGEDRPIKKVTGITIDLGDDDNVPNFKPRKPLMDDEIPTLISQSINCNSEQDIMDAMNDMNTPRGRMMNDLDGFSGINEIDMECSIGEDDDDFIPTPKRKPIFDEDEPELVSEEIIQEKRPARVSQGKVEDDYWERLAKKHKATNVKGAHNMHVRYGGNPELEKELFNHDMTPQGKIPTVTDGVPAGVVAHDAAYTADISSGEMSGGEGMACGESKKKDNNRQLFENLLIITGFKLDPKDNGFIIKDNCGVNDDVECCDEKDCINKLRPYIDDAFIVPLQVQTGQKFNEPQEWVNWYTPEIEKQYPKYKSDIDYCKMLLNYLNK